MPASATALRQVARRAKCDYLSTMGFEDFDQWLGKTLFVPPIIKFCHVTRQSQHAVSRMFWFAASLDGLYHADAVMSWIIWGMMSVATMVTAVMRADDPTTSFLLFRMLSVAFLVMDLLQALTIGRWAGLEFWLLVLIAEYAATIRTLPPAESAKRVQKRADAPLR